MLLVHMDRRFEDTEGSLWGKKLARKALSLPGIRDVITLNQSPSIPSRSVIIIVRVRVSVYVRACVCVFNPVLKPYSSKRGIIFSAAALSYLLTFTSTPYPHDIYSFPVAFHNQPHIASHASYHHETNRNHSVTMVVITL